MKSISLDAGRGAKNTLKQRESSEGDGRKDIQNKYGLKKANGKPDAEQILFGTKRSYSGVESATTATAK
ncbi:hypothetical protein [Mesorhizobium sp. YM1C-6-2]|uniref:hypothetical protein n=1 Tax=Mesorhizobium sp. YM1C-6-2 TaxID=1827501 RepID=UPI000EF195DF|nr:hypothetical protein [Mesorhizobium sp. YM1C-6-2]RLP22906.1 hypothetical protein D8676_21875 [Mesorhizobium sp. YM1C-6-2]